MKCPIDDTALVMTERHGVEIDYCPTCRGVWLDRGELDKIIDKAAPSAPPVALAEPPRGGASRDDRPRDRDSNAGYGDRGRQNDGYAAGRDYDDDRRSYKKRRGGFLDDLFDF